MEFGKLKRLREQEIRTIWPFEKDFSLWLATNISNLNNILNIRIEIQEMERPVDIFKLDMSGTDAVSQRPVVIENQYGKSDHDHLGKLITYSADREAGILIWVANEIQVAHRNAVEWLNKITPQEMSFYAIELEVLVVDDSKPAPNFRLIAGPPPGKRREITPADQVTPRNKQYQQFFNRLRKKLLDLQPNFTRARGLPQSWWGLGIGKVGFSLTAAFTNDNKFRIELYIDTGVGESNEAALATLSANSSSIDSNIGHVLNWDQLPNARACRVYVVTDGSIDDDDRRLEKLVEWGAPIMVKFREVFAPLVKNIDLPTST